MVFRVKHEPVSLSGENMPTPLVRDSRIDVTLAGAGKQMFKERDAISYRIGFRRIFRGNFGDYGRNGALQRQFAFEHAD
jgi:hypothetical protein